MKRLTGWLANFKLVVAFGVGGIAGTLLSLPLGWQLPGASAELIGGAFGAIIAIGGAVLVWKMQEQRKADQTVTVILASTDLALANINGLAATDHTDVPMVSANLDACLQFLKKARAMLELFHTVVVNCSPNQIVAFHGLLISLEQSEERLGHDKVAVDTFGATATQTAIDHASSRSAAINGWLQKILNDLPTE